MTGPGDVTLDQAVRVRTADTARGEFAALECVPTRSALPRGCALLVPGFTGSKEDFAALLPLLAGVGWVAASYDQRGQYETVGGADDGYTLDDFADDAAAVADSLFGTSERVHLVGHSFGGLVAGTAAMRDRSRWASLTLLCSGPGGYSAGARHDELLAEAESIPRLGLEASYQARTSRYEARGFPRASEAAEAFQHRRFLTSSPESLAAISRLLAETPDRTDGLAALELPITLIRGENDTWPHDVQDEFAAALGTHVEVIEGAAHSPAAEQPELTRDALARAFLR